MCCPGRLHHRCQQCTDPGGCSGRSLPHLWARCAGCETSMAPPGPQPPSSCGAEHTQHPAGGPILPLFWGKAGTPALPAPCHGAGVLTETQALQLRQGSRGAELVEDVVVPLCSRLWEERPRHLGAPKRAVLRPQTGDKGHFALPARPRRSKAAPAQPRPHAALRPTWKVTRDFSSR